jgi:hypothetical protein
MPGRINNNIYLPDYIDSFRNKLSHQINKLDITESTDTVELFDQFKEEFTIEPIILGEPAPSKPKETYLDRKDSWGEQYRIKVYKLEVKIPFTGDKKLFDCKPSSSQVIYINHDFEIKSQFIWVLLVLDELDADIYIREINKFKSDLLTNMPTIIKDISLYNSQLDGLITSLLEDRSKEVAHKFDFMQKIGLQINPDSDEYMIPSPITKKQIPIPVMETEHNIVKNIVPILQNNVYEDIKQVIYNVGRAIERKPSIFLKKHEEDLRDIFLLFLETRYDSTTGVGEAFNKGGRTDILLKYSKDGSNVFVAECKFWKGQKKMLEAIDQLLSYLTHRDSKTALIIFIDQKDFTSILYTIRTEVVKHPQFKKHIRDGYNSSISYLFSLPGDEKSTIQIEFMMFHFPKER